MAKAQNPVSHTKHMSKGESHMPVGPLCAEQELGRARLPAPLHCQGSRESWMSLPGMSVKEWHFSPQQHPFLKLIPRAASPGAVS